MSLQYWPAPVVWQPGGTYAPILEYGPLDRGAIFLAEELEGEGTSSYKPSACWLGRLTSFGHEKTNIGRAIVGFVRHLGSGYRECLEVRGQVTTRESLVPNIKMPIIS